MIKKILPIIFILLLNFGSYSNEIDSLLNGLDNSKIDSIQLKLNRKIGDFYLYNNNNKAIEYFEVARNLATKLNNKLAMANNLYSLGYCHLQLGHFEKSLFYYQESIKIYELLGDKRRLSNALLSVGNLFSTTKNFKKSDEYYTLAEGLIATLNNSQQASYILSERAIAFEKQGDHTKAFGYLEKTLKLAEQSKDTQMVNATLVNIALNYKHQKNTALALSYCNKALNNYNTTGHTDEDILAGVYNNLASIQLQAKNFTEAKTAFEKSLTYSISGNYKQIEMENYRNMADMYGQMKQYENQTNYLNKYYGIKDSLFTIESKNQLTQIEADYQIGKKNLEIIKQETEVSKQKNERNLFLLLSIGACLLLSTLFYFYKKTKKNNAELVTLNTQILNQKDELQNLNHVKDRLFSIISHDLRNPLITLRNYLQLSDNETLSADKKLLFKNRTMDAVSQTGNMLDNLLAWANMQIKNTKPTITPIEVADCIDDVISVLKISAEQKYIIIQQNFIPIEAKLDEFIALADFEILAIALRNILTNAIKFSNKHSTIYIKTSKQNQQISIAIKDEGIGLTKDQIDEIEHNQNNSTVGTNGEKGSGLGLFLVKEFLKKINATMNIESETGKGSTFTINLNSIN
jgi:two-component system, NtrC family, sensor kinase